MKTGICKVSVVLDVCFYKSIFESIVGWKKFLVFNHHIGFYPVGSEGKESASDAGILDVIPGWGRPPGGGHDNPLQYSCLENSIDRGAWQATVHRVPKSQT